MQEIVLTPKILGPHEIRGPRLSPFYPNGKSAPVGIYSFCFKAVVQDQIVVKTARSNRPFTPSNLTNMKRIQFLIGLFDRAHKSPITENISFKR